jgi:hypothetical protein
MKLYKYVGPGRIDILQKQQIRFSQPYALNDPFESQPFYSDYEDISPFKQLADLARIVKVVEETGEIPVKEVADYELIRKRPQKNILSWYVNTNFVSLSLTAKHDDLVMWSHYGANHSGMVLELDSDHPFFTDKSRFLYRVPYSKERPAITLREFEELIVSMARQLKSPEPVEQDKMRRLIQLFQKSDDWLYEKEWRLLAVPEYAINYKKGDHHYTIKIGGDTPVAEHFDSSYIALYRLPPECITAIYCGARIVNNVLRKLYFLMENNPCYAHIKLQIGVLDEQVYKLNFRQVKAIDVLTLGELEYYDDVQSGKRPRHIPKWYSVSPLDRIEKERNDSIINF